MSSEKLSLGLNDAQVEIAQRFNVALVEDLKRMLFEQHVCPALLQGILFKEAQNVGRTVEEHPEILDPMPDPQCTICGRQMDGYYHPKDECNAPTEEEIEAAEAVDEPF